MTTRRHHPDSTPPERPLAGILVADFSRVLAGPLTTMWLADLGATVIKVEHPARGDDTRHWGPPWTTVSSSYFQSANRSKFSVALDLSQADDLLVAKRLAARADVLVENFLTGTTRKWGLDHSTLSRSNARVITCSITGYGSGAGAHLPGYDFIVQAVGGLMSITGAPDHDPTKAGVALVDVLTAKDAVIGIMAALRARESSGRGQRVEVNLLSSLLGSLANQASSYLATGESPSRMGNQHPSIAPYETLRCRDGLIAVACGNDSQFRRFCSALGAPSVAEDARFLTNADRVRNRDPLVFVIEQLLEKQDVHEWESRLTAVGVPCGQVGSISSAFQKAAELGLAPISVLPAPHPPQVAHPIRYSATPVRQPVAPPDLGADTAAVAAWLDGAGPVEQLDSLLGNGT